tara:strand:+ start:1555 stop:2127 length:573 start_codon:yes stop_codon:yes gene_type:complete
MERISAHLLAKDEKMFKKVLKESTYYFEWGAGGSTALAAECKNIGKIITVESDKEWIQKMTMYITNLDDITFIHNEMDTRPKDWGNPGNNATNTQKRNYSDRIMEQTDANDIDLILIDGRFRVACALKAHAVISDNCVIAFDDYLDRQHYHIIEYYYEIIDRGDRMVLLQKIPDVIPPPELISEYELKKD